MIDLSKLHPRHWNLRVVWDLFMVWVAVINLTLILFDLSYLVLRPTYLHWVPIVVDVYDPVKGIEEHPLTAGLIDEAAAVRQLVFLDPSSLGLEGRVDKLRRLTATILENDPFERSRQSRSLEVMRVVIAQEIGRSTLEMTSRKTVAEAVELFWPDDPALLAKRIELFDEQMRPLLEVNYFREYGLGGHLEDYFWILDLPFWSFFVAEFAVRWSLAVRRRTYLKWFFFPIFNWYDLVGLIPYTQFRIFRLFRIASIYMRLRRSELTRVGKDVLSRSVAYVSSIVAEEISDAVALRILDETQEEIRDRTHVRIFNHTVSARRHRIEEVAVDQVRALMANETVQNQIRELLRLNLENAVDNSRALRAVPLPNAVLQPLVRSLGEIILETTLQTVTTTLDSREGRAAARDLVATIVDQVLVGPGRAEVDALGEEISLHVLEEMKDAVAVKKWTLPDNGSLPGNCPPDEEE